MLRGTLEKVFQKLACFYELFVGASKLVLRVSEAQSRLGWSWPFSAAVVNRYEICLLPGTPAARSGSKSERRGDSSSGAVIRRAPGSARCPRASSVSAVTETPRKANRLARDGRGSAFLLRTSPTGDSLHLRRWESGRSRSSGALQLPQLSFTDGPVTARTRYSDLFGSRGIAFCDRSGALGLHVCVSAYGSIRYVPFVSLRLTIRSYAAGGARMKNPKNCSHELRRHAAGRCFTGRNGKRKPIVTQILSISIASRQASR